MDEQQSPRQLAYAAVGSSGRVLRNSIMGGAIGAAITIPAVFLGAMSGGAGHGDYGFARALFPIPMLTTLLFGDRIALPVIVLALGQFPVYGALVGAGIGRKEIGWKVVAAVFLIHVIGMVACFAGLIPNFS